MSTIILADPTDYGNEPGQGPLRPGGLEGVPVVREGDLPSTLSPAARKQRPALELVRDLEEGNERVKGEMTKYLPRSPGEDPENYAARLQRSVFFNVFGHTVEGLTGFVFRKDPVLGDDVPAPIKTDWENIDNAGTHGDVFARDLLQDALTAGHNAILVEYPKTGGTQTAHDEKFELRPYWVPIKKDQILSWRTTVENGRTILAQVVIEECTDVPDGAFGETKQTRYRVLYREGAVVGWRLLEITKHRSVKVVDEGLFLNQIEIPLAEVTTSGRRGILNSQPPLIDLAYLNVAHYQQWSDQATSIHKTCVPILLITGHDAGGTNDDGSKKPPLVIGPNTAISLPDPNADGKYVSHDGSALGSAKASLDDLKSDMATLGISMLASQKRVAETAEAKRIDKSAADSALGVTARGLQDAIERALGFHARYRKAPSGGSITINRDFDSMIMEPEVMNAYCGLARDLGFPLTELLEMLKQGGRLPADANVEELAGQMLADQEAKAAAKEAAARDAAVAAKEGGLSA